MTGVGNDWKWKVRGQVGDIGKWGLFNAESVSGKSPKTDGSIKNAGPPQRIQVQGMWGGGGGA